MKNLTNDNKMQDISNVLEDDRLSWEAKGVFAFIYGQKSDEVPNVMMSLRSQLREKAMTQEHAFNLAKGYTKGYKELRDLGYIYRDDDTHIIITDEPVEAAKHEQR